ncbi:MAG: HEAT repeat domain-containing protein [Planctomycetes bacterium]|nr:HEAT repeat domain-containing protein [Planctomycetota bacterium]
MVFGRVSRLIIPILVLVLVGNGSIGPFARDVKRSEKFAGPIVEPPSREFDFRHIKVRCEFDWGAESVVGEVTHSATVLRGGTRGVRLDAVDLDVGSVRLAGGGELSFENFEDYLQIDFGRPFAAGEAVEFTVSYSARPKKGVYFKKPTEHYPDTPMQLWSQGEAVEARHWIPCFDHPSDRITSEIIATVPGTLKLISNGRLLSEKAQGKKATYHWLQDKSHVTYLITVVAGEFATWTGEADGVSMTGYVPRHYADRAARSFDLTPDMMHFFNEKIGYRYPWDRYDQLCVYEYPYGGMENTTATTLTQRTLHDERAALDVSSSGLVAHELVHQWFGDLVTCKDWGDIWLNESFATFFDNYYHEHHLGWEEALFARKDLADRYMDEDRNEYRRPLAVRRYSEPSDVFDRHAYPKGARIVNMLRYVLGDERFLAGIKHYLQRNQFRSVETADLRVAMEEATGQSLRWFFDQWIYAGGHPEFKITKKWDEENKTQQITVRQKQKVDDLTPLFNMPVVIELTTPAGTKTHRVRVTKREETFSFPVSDKPRMVRFDPGDWILKEVEFKKSRAELIYQLKHDSDMMGRLRAATDIEKFVDQKSVVDELLGRLEKEPFWGVRIEIVKTLAKAKGEHVADALIKRFAREPKSRVRRQIVKSVAEVGGKETVPFLRRAVADDRSYFVIADALREIGDLLEGEALSDARSAFDRDSHRDVIRTAAIAVFSVEISQETDEERQRRLETLRQLAAHGRPIRARAAALRAVGKLGKGSEEVYQLLIAGLKDEHRRIRRAAVSALGKLGDSRAIEELEKLRTRDQGELFNAPVENIDASISEIRRAVDGSEIEKSVEELRSKSADLEKRLKKLEELREKDEKRG